jgi:hypothetical protein
MFADRSAYKTPLTMTGKCQQTSGSGRTSIASENRMAKDQFPLILAMVITSAIKAFGSEGKFVK